MNRKCAITQDLLPLYEEELLQPETKKFVDEHLQNCDECRGVAEQSQIPLAPIEKSELSSKKMIRKITLRLTTIQVFFVAIAFILAMTTSVMNSSVGFVVTYPILGAITYLFYRSVVVSLLIAAIPTFLWSCLLYMTDLLANYYADSFLEALGMALISLVIHMLFTIIGIAFGFCVRNILEVK